MRTRLIWACIIIFFVVVIFYIVDRRPMTIESILMSSRRQTSAGTLARVLHVVDGDTFDVSIRDQHVRVRLIGVDTPETVDPRKSVQCYGPEASAFTKSLLQNKDVTLSSKPDEDEDQYHRKLRYVSVDGHDVGSELLERGYAKSLCARFPHPKCELYTSLETIAKREKRGRWGECGKSKNNERIETFL